MTRKYSDEEKEFILEYRKNHSARETSERFNELFGRNSSRAGISKFCTKYGQNYEYERYSEEEDEWLRANVPNMTTEDIVKEFNKHFNSNRTKPSLSKHYRTVLGLYCSKDEYRKSVGNTQRYPIGTIRLMKSMAKNGTKNEKKDRSQLFIKLTDDWRWTRLCDYIWECNNGPIPDGYFVIHLDNDLMNNRIDNLYLLSKTENAYMVHSRFYFDDSDLTRSGAVYSQLMAAIKERSK